MRQPRPVSYAHLDVYKRQSRLCHRHESFGPGAVHQRFEQMDRQQPGRQRLRLDVYKRQVQKLRHNVVAYHGLYRGNRMTSRQNQHAGKYTREQRY